MCTKTWVCIIRGIALYTAKSGVVANLMMRTVRLWTRVCFQSGAHLEMDHVSANSNQGHLGKSPAFIPISLEVNVTPRKTKNFSL